MSSNGGNNNSSVDNGNNNGTGTADQNQAAINDGCRLRALATDTSGKRASGQQLVLRRIDVSGNNGSSSSDNSSSSSVTGLQGGEATSTTEFQPFGNPRTTDSRGLAEWKFSPNEGTNFVYEVTTANGVRPSVHSNPVQIDVGSTDGATNNNGSSSSNNNNE